MEQLIAQYWGPILAAGILGAFVIPPAIRLWREYQEDKRTCGPGCICAGENRVEARQNVTVYVQNPQPNYPPPAAQPQIVYLQAPQQPQQPQAPQVIYLQAPPQHQPMYLQAPPQHQQQHYLPAPQQQQPVYLPGQPIYLQAPPQHQQQHYLPAPQYQPQQHYPAQQTPQSYYDPALEPYVVEYEEPRPARYLPRHKQVGQLPPASASDVEEARRREKQGRRK